MYRDLGNRTFLNATIYYKNHYGLAGLGYRLDLGLRAEIEVYHRFKYQVGGWNRV